MTPTGEQGFMFQIPGGYLDTWTPGYSFNRNDEHGCVYFDTSIIRYLDTALSPRLKPSSVSSVRNSTCRFCSKRDRFRLRLRPTSGKSLYLISLEKVHNKE